MTSTSGVRRARSNDRRRQLIDAATLLFADRGYPHVSVADIARHAGVSAPTVYRHFEDKQALLFDAVQASVDDLEANTAAANLDEADDPAEALAVAAVRLSMSNPQSTSLWRWSGQHLSVEQNREVVRRTRSVLRQWASAIGSTRPDLTERETMYLAGAVLSVVGSVVGRAVRTVPLNVEAELLALLRQILRLTPSDATPLIEPAGIEAPGTRRDEILDAAAVLFSRKGFAGTGVDDIGAAVGITGPSVYKHFPSKNAILLAIGQRSGNQLDAWAMVSYAASPDPAVRLRSLVDTYVHVITSSPDLIVALTSGYSLAGDPHAGELVASQRRYVARWIQLLTEYAPERSVESTGLVVHAALAIVNDAERLPRSTPRPEFAARMAYLMKGLLGV